MVVAGARPGWSGCDGVGDGDGCGGRRGVRCWWLWVAAGGEVEGVGLEGGGGEGCVCVCV